jgi:transposase-like protein
MMRLTGCVLKKMIQGQAVSLKVGSNFQDSFSEKIATFQERSE